MAACSGTFMPAVFMRTRGANIDQALASAVMHERAEGDCDMFYRFGVSKERRNVSVRRAHGKPMQSAFAPSMVTSWAWANAFRPSLGVRNSGESQITTRKTKNARTRRAFLESSVIQIAQSQRRRRSSASKPRPPRSAVVGSGMASEVMTTLSTQAT